MAITGERLIYNLALGYIGEYYVEDDSATETKQYIACNRYYEQARDEVLVAHPWNEAKRRIIIAQEADNLIFGYDERYAIPSDCLRVLSVNDSVGADVSNNAAGIDAWEVEGDYILSDAGTTPQTWSTGTYYVAGEFFTYNSVTYEVISSHTSTTVADDEDSGYISSTGGDYKIIYVEYITQLTDTTKFSPKLKQAIAVKLAIKIITLLTNDTKGKIDLINEFERLTMPKARSVDAMQGKPRRIFNSEWLRSRQGSSGGWYVV